MSTATMEQPASELVVQTPADLAKEVPAIVARARELRIVTADDFTATGEWLKTIKGAANRVAAFFKPMKQAQGEAKKRILEAEKKLADPLAEAERLTKGAMLTYQQAEQKKADDERRRLQAIADEKARVERQKAEQAAERQRQIEAEQRKKAEAARLAAESADAAERKRLLDEADAAQRKADQAQAKADVKEEAAMAVAAPVIAVQSVAPKIAGQRVSTSWKAEIVDLSLFLGFVFDTRRADLVLPNEKILDALAKGLKEQASMPGVKFKAVQTMASGR